MKPYEEIAVLLAIGEGWLAKAKDIAVELDADKPFKSLPFTKVEPRQIIFVEILAEKRMGKYGELLDIEVFADGDLDHPEKIKELKPPMEATLGLSHAALKRGIDELAAPLKGKRIAIANRGEVLIKKGKAKGKSFFDYKIKELA